MDNLRFVLIAFFCLLVYMLWEAWQLDYGPKRPRPVAEQQAKPAVPGEQKHDDVPQMTNEADDLQAADPSTSVSAVPEKSLPTGKKISVLTDTLRLEVDTRGGQITSLELLDYPVNKEKPNGPIRLFSEDPPDYFVSQSGILASNNSAPNHYSDYQAEATQYQLQPGQDSLKVPLRWRNQDGIEVEKSYILKRGSYLIELQQRVSNRSNNAWRGRQYEQLQRTGVKDEKSHTFIRTYTGGVIYNEEDKYEKIDFEDMFSENLNVAAKGGWHAFIQHYFVAAWIPPAEEVNHFYTKVINNEKFVIGSYSSLVEIQPGGEKAFSARLFAGPKLQNVMEEIAPGLELTVDYGALTFIAKPIFHVLSWIHSYIGNWGWAIIGITFLIKAIFFKLSEASYKSMARLRRLQPKLQALKERFADDKARFNQEMMGLYKKEKVNPLGGCLPILVQIPVFISLYWVLIETVELRQAPFLLWLKDLSSQDPYFILPLLMGISMWIQQKLSPTPTDPMQEKIMKLFPVIFTVFFLFFPAGLVLYWVINNSLSIIQQWYITRQIEAEAKA